MAWWNKKTFPKEVHFALLLFQAPVLNKDIADFEFKILEKCKNEKSEIIDSISSSGKLEEDSEKLLVELITSLKKNFNS